MALWDKTTSITFLPTTHTCCPQRSFSLLQVPTVFKNEFIFCNNRSLKNKNFKVMDCILSSDINIDFKSVTLKYLAFYIPSNNILLFDMSWKAVKHR